MSAPLLATAPLGAGAGAAALAALGVLLALGLAVGLAVSARRRTQREAREIVQRLESLRAGQPHAAAAIDTDSPLALVGDAVQRLGHDLRSKLSEAERTAGRWRALTAAEIDTAVVTTDGDGDVRSFSTGAERLFGRDELSMRGRPASELFDEATFAQLLPLLTRRTARAEGVALRGTMRRDDDTTFEADISVRALAGPDGDTLGFVLVARDATPQVELERRLRASETRYRTLVERLAEGLVLVREGRIEFANNAARRVLALPEQPEGTVLRDRVATHDVLVVEERLAELTRRPGTSDRFRCTLVDDDGATVCEARVQASHVEADDGPAVLLLIEDETAERRIESELRGNEARLDAVLEATSDGVLVVAEQPHGDRVVMTNHAFVDLFDLPQSSYLGRPVTHLGELLRRRGGGSARVAALIESAGGEVRRESIAVGDPVERELSVIVSPLVGQRGDPLGRVIAVRDLSDQRRSERELQDEAEQLQLSKVELEQSYRRLREVNERLEARGAELDRLNQELQRLDEMRVRLIGNVAHELQTPLVSIRGYTEMILKERLGPITDEQRQGLKLSLTGVDRLISMIDGLSTMTKADDGGPRLKLDRFSLQALVEEVTAMLRDRLSARGMTLTTAIDGGDMLIHADRDRIAQVLTNLVTNAIKFGNDDGHVEITARAATDSGEARLVVADDGPGIPVADQARIFDRNYRVEREGRPAADGRGLGLAIVREILALHGCRIAVDSREGEGARFSFSLPLARGRQSDRTPEDAASDGGSEERGARGSATVIDVRHDEAPVEPTPAEPDHDEWADLDGLLPDADELAGLDEDWPAVPDEREPEPDAVPDEPAPDEDDRRPPKLRIIRRRGEG